MPHRKVTIHDARAALFNMMMTGVVNGHGLEALIVFVNQHERPDEPPSPYPKAASYLHESLSAACESILEHEPHCPAGECLGTDYVNVYIHETLKGPSSLQAIKLSALEEYIDKGGRIAIV